MTTLAHNGFESGEPGQNVDATTSAGANDDSLAVTVAGGSAITFDDTWQAHGTQSAKVHAVAGQPAYVSKTLPAGTSQAAARKWINADEIPASSTIFQIRNASGAVATIGTSSTRRLTLVDAANGSPIWTAASVLPSGKVWLEIGAGKGTTTSNGTLKVSYGSGDSTSAIESGPTTPTARNAGTADLTELRAGKVGTTAPPATADWHIDDIRILTATTGPVGAYVPAVKPGKPTDVTAVAGTLSAVVGWTPPVDTGTSGITSYTARASTGQTATVSAGPTTTATVTGLTAGVPVTFTVEAINTSGTGDRSIASAAVTPTATPAPPSGGLYLLRGGVLVPATFELLVNGALI